MLEGQSGYLLPNSDVAGRVLQRSADRVELPPSVGAHRHRDRSQHQERPPSPTSFKPAKTETGLIVQVPPFVNSGEKIKVNTNDGAYMERM